MRRIIFREKVKSRSDSNYGTLEDGFRKYCGIQDGCTFKEFLGDAGFLHIANTLDRHKIRNRLSNFIYIYLCLVLLFLFISFVAFNISPIVGAISLLLGLSIFTCTLWFVDDLQKRLSLKWMRNSIVLAGFLTMKLWRRLSYFKRSWVVGIFLYT